MPEMSNIPKEHLTSPWDPANVTETRPVHNTLPTWSNHNNFIDSKRTPRFQFEPEIQPNNILNVQQHQTTSTVLTPSHSNNLNVNDTEDDNDTDGSDFMELPVLPPPTEETDSDSNEEDMDLYASDPTAVTSTSGAANISNPMNQPSNTKNINTLIEKNMSQFASSQSNSRTGLLQTQSGQLNNLNTITSSYVPVFPPSDSLGLGLNARNNQQRNSFETASFVPMHPSIPSKIKTKIPV